MRQKIHPANWWALVAVCLVAAGAVLTSVYAQQVQNQRQDPRPYAPIAIQLADTLDQIVRDSATIQMGRIRLNQAGYRPGDDKFFYYVGQASSFSILDANTGAVVYTGTLASKNTNVTSQMRIRASNNAQIMGGGDTRYIMESEVIAGPLFEGKIEITTPGQYRIRVGTETSGPFWIHENVWGWVRDAVIKFPGVNRCGDTHSWFHGACHLQDATPGGWHDCGDHLKESITQSFLHAMLALGSAALRDHDADHYGRNHNHTVHTDGIPDVLYEAKHGSDYVITAYDNANGNVANMITAIGGFGPDHQWWGRPEFQDRMSFERGGPPREARNEIGMNVLGHFAAGLALTAKNYAVFDSAHAAKSIRVARDMYAYARTHRPENTETPAYSGNARFQEKMAFAALGLLYATGEREYLNDLAYDRTIFDANRGPTAFPNFEFDGGWLAHEQPQFSKGTANTDWASTHMPVLWGFFRLILKDEQMCARLGITPQERSLLLARVINQILFNIQEISRNGSSQGIVLPSIGHWDSFNNVTMRYDDIWKSMSIQMNWMWNRYQFGNIFDLFVYSDMAMWLEENDIQLPGRTGTTNWRWRETRQLVVRQLDYMLGVNPWGMSMIYEIGHRNSNHPHHRAANPEGKNMPGAIYRYRPPAGALHAGASPAGGGQGASGPGVYWEHYDDYFVTETGIDASAIMIIPIMGMAKEDPITDPPAATVRVVYVGVDRAIIEVRQTRFGLSTIRYAADGVTVFANVRADSAGMFHQITLTGLTPATRYNFDALIADMFGNSDVILDRGEYFTFVTLTSPPGRAEITNVKVCKVTSDSAEIFWYTPNGAYDSRVVFGETRPVTANNGTVVDGNIYGRPSQFHYVKIGGLKEQTTYYFYVENNGTRDDNNGQFYTFTTPVEHVVFDIRVLKYSETFFGLNVINHDIKDYDSLELRLYVRAPDTVNTPNGRFAFSDHIGLRLDIGIKYRSDGFQDAHFKTEVDQFIQSARPVRIADTYNPADNTWGFYIPIPLGGARMESGARFRLDFMFDTRSHWPPYQDLMNVSPTAELLNMIWSNGWSFIPHSRAAGAPVDYPGVPTGDKDDIDLNYWNTPINQYMTVYRKNEFVWGYSPSAREQQERRTHYTMTSLVTAPIHNPSEEYLFMEQVVPSITVNGWAQVTENGVINDIWVNGVRVRDVGSVAQYDFASDRWNLAIPVPMRNGGNNVDVTLFGGPDPASCATCHGCAFTNHSFYVEFKGAEPYPSTMRLESCANRSVFVRDTAIIDTTCFYIYVDDKNPSLNKDRRDTVFVTVLNPVLGDSIIVPLIETGDSTGIFISANQVRVVNHNTPPAQRGANDILMDGGQEIWVTYVDPTDSEDVSQMILRSRADFAVPVSAWFLDSAGIASINQVRVRFTRILDRAPDSLHLTIPGRSGVRSVRAPQDGIALLSGDRSVAVFSLNPDITDTTGFRTGEQVTDRTFLVAGGALREAVVTVADSAGPALIDQAMLFERVSGIYDTLQVTLSEPMPTGNIIGNTLVHRTSAGANNTLAVVNVLDSSLLNNTVMLLVNSDRNVIREGDSVFVNPLYSTTVDRAGNRAHIRNRPVPIVLRSAAPRILNAVYRDTNANGVIDEIELTFSKSLPLTGLQLSFSWENGPFVPILPWTRLRANASETVVTADITGLMSDSILTVGTMRVTATHNGYPNDTLRAGVTDRAAPVIRHAQFGPALLETERDTLTVTFSEPVYITASHPFMFLSGDDGATYTMSLQNPNPRVSYTQTFMVNSIENILNYPGLNDSVWISTTVATSDTNANIQSNPSNRRVKLSIKPAPLAITVIPAPNPFKPETKGSAGQPARIIVRPISKSTVDINLKGTIIIYDRMGNAVISENLTFDPVTQDLIYEWNGRNRKGRKAGSGTYLVKVAVEHVLEPWEEKVKPVTGQTLIYLKR